MLDSDGNAIESQFDYTLKQVTPSKKIGEYHYMVDAATFIECGTKRNYAASGIELEKLWCDRG